MGEKREEGKKGIGQQSRFAPARFCRRTIGGSWNLRKGKLSQFLKRPMKGRQKRPFAEEGIKRETGGDEKPWKKSKTTIDAGTGSQKPADSDHKRRKIHATQRKKKNTIGNGSSKGGQRERSRRERKEKRKNFGPGGGRGGDKYRPT